MSLLRLHRQQYESEDEGDATVSRAKPWIVALQDGECVPVCGYNVLMYTLLHVSGVYVCVYVCVCTSYLSA